MAESRIPIANIYYLFCYAWDRFDQARATVVGAESSPDLAHLLARVLIAGVHRVLRRGFDRDYQPMAEELPTVRGRIDLNDSIALEVRRVRRLMCEFDELSRDVLHNRVIKATMLKLSKVGGLDRELAHTLRVICRGLADVTDIRLTPGDFTRVQLHRNNAYYDFLLRVCRLAFDLMLPKPDGSGYQFDDVFRDEARMALIFEAFVRNFYRTEQKLFRVEPLQIAWDATAVSEDETARLPVMRTDIFLRNSSQQIIIDTKYYVEALQERFGVKSFRSGNLYQLFAYLKNAEVYGPAFAATDGMLLYPAVAHQIDACYRVQGHNIRIATVDLDQEWQAIDARLRSFLS